MLRHMLPRIRAIGGQQAAHCLAQLCPASSLAAAQGPPAFVFDIDGVLIRGRNVLPAALEAMQQLCPHGHWKYPVCFLTNGGGVSEARKAEQLAGWLGVPVGENQVVLSHTPMRSLAPVYGHRPVLVAGRGQPAAVAAGYGFHKVLTTDQLAAGLPTALPFMYNTFRAPGPSTQEAAAACPVRDLGWATAGNPLAAVLIMTDPADWYQDLQLLMDVITGHGDPLAKSPKPGSSPIPVYFSNPDLLWANEHPRPRFGQGAFAAALDALHRQVTGSPLPCAHWFGKPTPEPYRIAEQLLLAQAHELGLLPSERSQHSSAQEAVTQRIEHSSATNSNGISGTTTNSSSSSSSSSTPHLGGTAVSLTTASVTSSPSEVFSAIYAVGDNPAADVRGANSAGHPWVSVLVRTGVFQGPPSSNSPSDPAHIVVEDVLGAVQAAFHRSRSRLWHSLR